MDNTDNLRKILAILNSLVNYYDKPVIVSTHPRTRKRPENIDNMKVDQRIKFLKPFGFCNYVHLQKNSLCTISDSGTISEESAILSFPAITLRNAMERPEAIKAGTAKLVGTDSKTIVEEVQVLLGDKIEYNKMRKVTNPYGDGKAAERIIAILRELLC